MIAALRDLPAPRQRQLIRLLDPRVDLDDFADDEVFAALVSVLRRALEVPSKDDLPEYLRRRLVEVTKRHFELVEDTDALTDLELARLLVDFVLGAAAQLAEDAERREEFETFLRTKDRTERTRWLMESQRFAAILRNEAFHRDTAQRHADELAHVQAAHRQTAMVLLDNLSVISAKSNRKWGRASSGTLAARAAAGGAAAVALGPAAAIPLGALAGGLFMAGRAKRGLVKVAEEEATKTRAQRARRSKQVQAVVSLAAFVIASDAGYAEAR